MSSVAPRATPTARRTAKRTEADVRDADLTFMTTSREVMVLDHALRGDGVLTPVPTGIARSRSRAAPGPGASGGRARDQFGHPTRAEQRGQIAAQRGGLDLRESHRFDLTHTLTC